MSKASFRIYWVTAQGKRAGTLMRRFELLFDPPPPAAIGDDDDTVLAALAQQVAALRADDEDLARYLWTEDFEVRKVDCDIHPQTAAGGTYVIGASEIPLRIAYAACKTPGDAWRVLVPRFGWSMVLESLEVAPATLRAMIFAAMLGEKAAWVYDFRRVADESVAAWEPSELAAWTRDRKATDEPEAVPALDAIAEDWVHRAERKRLPVMVGVDPIFDEHAALLDRERPPSLLLVGPSGVGKTAFVRRVARHLLDRGRDKGGTKRRLWATSADRILAGMIYLGMWQERCLEISRELTARGDWLYADRLVDLVAPQSDGAAIADLLAPAVIAGELRMIAECDESELLRCRQRNAALVDAFTVIRFDEPAAGHVLPLLATYQERKDPSVALHPEAARRLVRLLGAFRRDVRFPGKAFAFLDWWNAERAGARTETPTTTALLLPHDVVAAYSRWSGLPVELISDEHPAGADDIAGQLRRAVVGQDGACAIAARVLARFKAGLDDPERPVGTLFFAGPTGVGKTELAKQIATYMFGGVERLIRVDMSEYMNPGAAARLLEVGGGAGAHSLAERVRQAPLCVILLDEIEKAHPEIFDLLLGVLGEGRLTDSLGRLVDFRMAVIVMTSNLGARESRSGFGSAGGGDGTASNAGPSLSMTRGDHAAAVRAHFRPELLGRLDHVVAFKPLGLAEVERIVTLEIEKVRRRPGLVARHLELRLSPHARTRLAERGFDARLGARPLRRLIEDAVIAPLAVRMAAEPAFRDRPVEIVVANEVAGLADPIVV